MLAQVAGGSKIEPLGRRAGDGQGVGVVKAYRLGHHQPALAQGGTQSSQIAQIQGRERARDEGAGVFDIGVDLAALDRGEDQAASGGDDA